MYPEKECPICGLYQVPFNCTRCDVCEISDRYEKEYEKRIDKAIKSENEEIIKFLRSNIFSGIKNIEPKSLIEIVCIIIENKAYKDKNGLQK